MMTTDKLRAARDLYADKPSHYRGMIRPEEDGCVCIVEAFARTGASFADLDDFRHFVRVESLADWNADHSTEEVLDKLDEYILMRDSG